MEKEEKLAQQIAIGKRKFISVEKTNLPKVIEIIEENYIGKFTCFGLGSILCMRDKKEPMKLK